MLKKLSSVVLVVLLYAGASYAGPPLITDEAETLDKGEAEIELTAEFSVDKDYVDEVKIEEQESEVQAKVIYGIVDNLELELEVPYLWVKEKEDGAETFNESGMGDVGLELKWRFYNEDDLSFALKPAVAFPTGDSDKELGTGNVSYGLSFLTSKEFDSAHLAFHLNVGIMHYDYKNEEEKAEKRPDIWNASLAAEKGIVKGLKVVVDLGTETNSDRNSNTNPAYALGGLVYSVLENLEVGLGAKFGLNDATPDYAIIAGAVYAF